MATVTTTHYVPNENGWSNRGYFFRLKVDQDYDNVNNKSVLTVSLESYHESYSGTHNFLDNSENPTYIKADGNTLVTLGTAYKITYNASNTWQQIKSSSGPNEWKYTVNHNSSGNATVNFETAGRMYMYYNGNNYYGDMDKTMSYTFTGVRAFSLSISAGANSSIAVTRGGSALSSTDLIYYEDVLTITFGADEGYNLGTHTVNGETFISGETHMVYDDVFVISDATVKSYKLRISAGEGSTINVSRTESPLQNADISDLNNDADIYYNDKLEITFSAETGYNLTTTQVNNNDFSGGEYTVKGDVSVASAASLKSYTLTIQPDAHSNISVYKDGSALSSGDTIYHFDALLITVTANGGYKIKSAEINGTSLTPNVENSYEVSGDVIIVAISSALGFVYIQDGGATPSPYIIYVGSEDGSSLERYRVYIGTESNGVIPY